MLFFENENLSQPRYFASMPGIPESKEQYSNNNRATSKKNDGFRDPDGKYPTDHRLGEPDVHRLARGVSDETLVTTKNQERDLGVQTALGGNWSEPESPYAAQYPHNHVIATHGGITIELDSTPGSTRLHLYHPSNSFIEIDNDGNMVVRNNNAEKYEIVTAGKNIYIKQQRNITIDAGSKKKVQDNEVIEVGLTKTEEIGEDMNQTIGNDKTEDISNDKTESIGNDKTSNIGNDKSETIGGNKSEDISGSKSEDIGGSKTEDIGGSKTEDIGGSLNITVSGPATLTASSLTINCNTQINGNLAVAGTGTATGGDFTADGISLKSHTHAQGADSDGNAEQETNPPS
jgi:hypothetical protein